MNLFLSLMCSKHMVLITVLLLLFPPFEKTIPHLEPDILEYEVKQALGSITTNKASEGDGIPVELFQILKDDAVKVLQLNMPENLENSAVATGLEKVSFHSSPKESQCQRMFKLPHNCTHLTCQQNNAQNSPSQNSTVLLNHELPDVQSGFRRGRGTRNQIDIIHWIIEKAREFQKKIYFYFTNYTKASDCVDHNKLWEILQEMRIP